jgi:hypothetical protein
VQRAVVRRQRAPSESERCLEELARWSSTRLLDQFVRAHED